MKRRLGCAVALPVMLFIFSLHGQSSDSVTNLGTNSVFVIDPPTVWRLTGAQNLDVQIARQCYLDRQARH
jgi:hypothetical protein